MMRFSVWAASCAALMLSPALEAKPLYDATITRTTFGVPHIEARDWRSVGYGVAYAYAEDNLCLLAEEFMTVAGERSQYFGPDAKAVLGFQEVDNLSSDLFFRAVIDLPALRDGAARKARESRLLTEGYVAGYNRYLRDIGPDGVPAECRGKGWVRPITFDDMLRLTEKQMLLAGSLALAPALANAAPPGAQEAGTAAATSAALPRPDEPGMGSKGGAFGSETTTDGRGLLIGNPHFPWKGPNRLWQMHIIGPDGYDAMGVGLPGFSIPAMGFNRDIAWTHTVTAARHYTLWQLTLDPADPTRYMLDGQSVAMEPRVITVPMPEGAAPVTRTLYRTRFGPVVAAPQNGLLWTAASAFTVGDANSGNQRGIETWLAIGKASSVREIKAAVSQTLGIPWVNTIAADRGGHALIADVTAVPNVSAAKIAACSTPLTRQLAQLAPLLDGARSECAWDVAAGTPEPGLMPASDQAATLRRDYLTNSNDSYWLANARIPHPPLSPILGRHAAELTVRTRSNFTETEALIAQGKVDHARAKALVFANKSYAADLTVKPMLALCARLPEPRRGCDALAGWDRRFEADSRGAALFRAFWARAAHIPGLWAVPFDPADPIATPREPDTAGAGDKLLFALDQAVAELDAANIPLDAEWGSIHNWPAGDERIPVHGGPGTAGVLNFQDSRPAPGGGLMPVHGSSYIQIVGFDAAGPIAEAILSYSQSTNPASPHYADQTRAYAAKAWHRLPFSKAEIAAAAISKPKRIAE